MPGSAPGCSTDRKLVSPVHRRRFDRWRRRAATDAGRGRIREQVAAVSPVVVRTLYLPSIRRPQDRDLQPGGRVSIGVNGMRPRWSCRGRSGIEAVIPCSDRQDGRCYALPDPGLYLENATRRTYGTAALNWKITHSLGRFHWSPGLNRWSGLPLSAGQFTPRLDTFPAGGAASQSSARTSSAIRR